MRNLIILVLVVTALMVVKSIVSQIIGAVAKGLRAESRGDRPQTKGPGGQPDRASGHLVKDPVSGVYIDERIAVKETVNGKTIYFESKANRDAYLKQHAG